jgi:hypothetical protein
MERTIKMRTAYISVRISDGKKSLGNPRSNRNNNIKTDLKMGMKVRTGFKPLRTRASGGVL